MLNFTAVRNKEMSMAELSANLSTDDLRNLTNEMVDTMLNLISDCTDADVTFIPQDPEAYDSAAATEEETHMAWTLGHVIVHTTASAEEAAFLAAELARGVPYREGRSRYEVPWQTITTIEQCRQRLEESRRMRLVSLDLWPNKPHLDNTFISYNGKSYTTIVRFVFGLFHDDRHLGQIEEIARQAITARTAEIGTQTQAA